MKLYPVVAYEYGRDGIACIANRCCYCYCCFQVSQVRYRGIDCLDRIYKSSLLRAWPSSFITTVNMVLRRCRNSVSVVTLGDGRLLVFHRVGIPVFIAEMHTFFIAEPSDVVFHLISPTGHSSLRIILISSISLIILLDLGLIKPP